jgi:hypothetical protein
MMRTDVCHVLLNAAVTGYERTLSRLAVSDDRLATSKLAQSDPAIAGVRRYEQMLRLSQPLRY